MELRTYSLRNYRVFEQLELEVPAGLVGIYGPNGAGKSALLEAMTWALYGRARTPKQGIPTTGTTGECVVELGFDHDEHHYVIRRTISGMNHTVKARVTTAGQTVADGPTEVGRYVRSLLGMDEQSFRSSVFAEQKQLAAFSDHTADQRRRLVLSLLGITPIEKARDEARTDARTAERDYVRLTAALPDTDELAARKAEVEDIVSRQTARVAAALVSSDQISATRRELVDQVRRSEERRREDAVIRANGQAARKERDAALARIGELDVEAHEISAGNARLDELRGLLSGFDDTSRDAIDTRIRALEAVIRTTERLAALPADASTTTPTDAPDPVAVRRAEERAAVAGAARAEADAARGAAERDLHSAQTRSSAASSLRDETPCPTCGQDIVAGVAAVTAHYQAEEAAAANRLASVATQLKHAERQQKDAAAELASARKVFAAAEVEWERGRQLRSAVQAAQVDFDSATELLRSTGGVPERATITGERADLREQLRMAGMWREEAARLAGRRERLERLDLERGDVQACVAEADERRARLRRELDQLAFELPEHQRLADEAAAKEAQFDVAIAELRQSEAALAAASRELAAIDARIEQISEQRARLGDLASRTVLLGRTAELLNGFRHAVVASVGPRLSAQASELFLLLTGSEYDGLEVDPETYEIQIVDQGVKFPTARFSGSEVDLANLALRVAISEQVRFQAGGQVGLLVLDEALASLDGDRKDRMLLALTQLSARFRQILVVTHSVEVKEQLPQAIEIVKLGPRRSTARLVGDPF